MVGSGTTLIEHEVNARSEISRVDTTLNGGTPTQTNYTYDQGGNLTHDGSFTYEFDAWGRVLKVSNSSGTQWVLHNTYDGLGRRRVWARIAGKCAAFCAAFARTLSFRRVFRGCSSPVAPIFSRPALYYTHSHLQAQGRGSQGLTLIFTNWRRPLRSCAAPQFARIVRRDRATACRCGMILVVRARHGRNVPTQSAARSGG